MTPVGPGRSETAGTVAAVVPAAGRGERLGAGGPKALVAVGDVPMVVRAVAGLAASGVVDVIVVAAPAADVPTVRSLLGARVTVVEGGADRVASVRAGLAVVPSETEVVLVHDAARCLCPASVVQAVVSAVRSGHDAVVPGSPVADTLKRVERARVVDTVDRSGLVGVQTPQGFSAALLRDVHDRAGTGAPVTDDAGLVEHAGGVVTVVPGDPRAFKITTPLDLAMAEALVAAGTA